MSLSSQISTHTQSEKKKISWGRRLFKWTWRTVLALFLLAGMLFAALYFSAMDTEQPVGFQVQQARSTEGKPIPIGIWYPTTSPLTSVWANSLFMRVAKNGEVKGTGLPLIVLSHGTGGGITSHTDLALNLASAGYVVAAPMHSDNYLDSSQVGTPEYFQGRNEQISTTIDFMLKQWNSSNSIDANKIGAYGFSIGGFTVLTAIGANPKLSDVAAYCANNKEFVCDMLAQSKSFLLSQQIPTGVDDFNHDLRIKAAVLAAPGLGFTFPNALNNVTVPIQIWQGEQDQLVPYETNSKLINESLPNKAEFHLVPNASHYSFLTPCGMLSFMPICGDPDLFDRTEFHQKMNKQVIDFYQQNLK